MRYPFFRAICLALLVTTGWLGCTLDEPAREPDQATLTLGFTQNKSLTNLTWNKVNITGFKEYILLQSDYSVLIPDGSLQSLLNASVSFLHSLSIFLKL